MPDIEFYWDAASPYTYLAGTQIEALAKRCGASLSWKPFLIGATFKATGNAMPAAVPAKGRYMRADLERWARHYGVPFNWPPNFPTNSLLVQRVACALPAADAARWAQAIMAAYWANGRDISQADTVAAVLRDLALDPAAVLEAAQEPAAKDRLRALTDEAVARGAFGAPTFFVGDAMFWGNDRLPLLEACLTGALAA